MQENLKYKGIELKGKKPPPPPPYSFLLQEVINFYAKSNHLEYLYVINYNFVNTERILKIRNSAESYRLADSDRLKCRSRYRVVF